MLPGRRSRKASKGWFPPLFLGLLLGGLILSPRPAAGQAEVYLEVQKAEFFKVPVILEDFRLEGLDAVIFAGRQRAEDILGQDLDYTDAFHVIRENPAGDLPVGLTLDIHGQPVDRPPQARVAGIMRRTGSRVELAVRLLDEATGSEIFSKTYDAGWDPVRLLASRWPVHRLADEITLYLTGTPGCATTQIAFVNAEAGHKEIHLTDWDGHHQVQLSRLGSIVMSPVWHPSGRQVAFTSFHLGQPVVAVQEIAEGRLRVLIDQKTPAAPIYSPDGRWIAYATTEDGNSEIYMARSDGTDRKRLTFHRGIDTAPSWSPSGKRLAFTSDRWGAPQLFTINADGTDLRQLTFAGAWNDSPDWSPLGDRIVHVCRIDKVFELALIHADGRGWRRLTIGGGCENPRWAPDGRHVVFARGLSGERSLWVLDVDSGRARRLTGLNSDSYNPAWSRTAKERKDPPNPGG